MDVISAFDMAVLSLPSGSSGVWPPVPTRTHLLSGTSRLQGVTVTTKLSREGEMYDETRRGDMIEHRRLMADTRKWLLSKCLPKIYGDKFSVESDVTLHDSIDKPPGETREQWIERKRRELATTPVQGHADG